MKTQYKYYYTDPLAAAWMAKNFGMAFVHPYSREPVSSESISGWEVSAINIHPNSLHLLEPQVGDIWVSNRGIGKILKPAEGKCTAAQMHGDHPKIIQRNGIPFMWPEVEK